MKAFSQAALASAVSPNSRLGFGCMGITAFYGTDMADDEALKLLRTVYDGGVRHFDTAEVYAENGKYNESVLGSFFKTVPRDSFTVATKYWPSGDNPNVYDYDDVKSHLVESLKRLELEYVDLYYAHRVLSLEGGKKFVATAKRLQAEGLIKEIGLSEVSGKWLRDIHTTVHPVDAVQQEWSLLTRNLERDLAPTCAELGVTIVAYSPLARNMLAKRVETRPSDWRGNQPRYAEENLKANAEIYDTVRALSETYGCSAAALSLAWLYRRADELNVAVVPIPGTTKVGNFESNLASSTVRITDGDCQILEKLADRVAGARGNEGYVSMGIESQT